MSKPFQIPYLLSKKQVFPASLLCLIFAGAVKLFGNIAIDLALFLAFVIAIYAAIQQWAPNFIAPPKAD